ncbi:class I SAM-dependent methyltransferase [Pseudotabrizicola sp. 4114]|uniref:class I SAM-dependent methyltransferase n=1 Tax=Pseudotabrizicola sp. 4114 TaxID=2817731 RepID=UPI0028565969|nr:SAM-dependent methyltransferase [Pseudorhodobacter sp. 4114]
MTESSDHFDRLYRANPDPWDYRTSGYEQRKYDATLAALTRHHYGSVLEAGCSIGVLSARLAQRCDRLLALDFSDLAVAQAVRALAPVRHAQARRATLPDDWPEGRYDLIMLSEFIYYLTPDQIRQTAQLAARDARDGAECVLVHWQGDTQTTITPNAARDLFCAELAAHRGFQTITHPTTGEYDHLTLLFDTEPE